MVFSRLCVGETKSNIAKDLDIQKNTLGVKLKDFKEVDEKKHIKFIISELKERLEELK